MPDISPDDADAASLVRVVVVRYLISRPPCVCCSPALTQHSVQNESARGTSSLSLPSLSAIFSWLRPPCPLLCLSLPPLIAACASYVARTPCPLLVLSLSPLGVAHFRCPRKPRCAGRSGTMRQRLLAYPPSLCSLALSVCSSDPKRKPSAASCWRWSFDDRIDRGRCVRVEFVCVWW